MKKLLKKITIALILAAAIPAAGSDVSEYGVKAAYLFNFTRFVEWPADSFGGGSAPLVIGVVGSDPFGSSLDDAIDGKSVGKHPLTVKRFGSFAKAGAALKKCQLLFIAYSEKDHLSEILDSVQGSAVLTVSEIEKFPLKGGMILFDQEGQKITLVVNPKSAEAAGLTLSSKLMQVAKVYNKE